MKKPLCFLSLLVLLSSSACQQSDAGKQVAVAETPLAVVAVGEKQAVSAVPAAALTPAVRTFTQKYNLAKLWRPANTTDVREMIGFFGADHYRFQLVLTSARKDDLLPNVYSVSGQDRFKGRITPFAGTIRLTDVQKLPVDLNDIADDDQKRQFYTATGTYTFEEARSSKGAGAFTGKVAANFSLDPAHPDRIDLFTMEVKAAEQSPTRGAVSLFEGQWRSYQTNKQKPTVWAHNFLPIAGNRLEDFNIGEREVSINPRYAKLGWNEYWTNEEWWATPGPGVARAAVSDTL